MHRGKRRPRRHGFTLLEVLLVLAILVILGSVVTVQISKTQGTAYLRTARVQISSLETPLEQYHIDVGTYPTTQQGLAALMQPPAELADTSKWAGPYVNREIPLDPWNNPYQYASEGDQYRIWSWGPDGQDGSGDDVSNM